MGWARCDGGAAGCSWACLTSGLRSPEPSESGDQADIFLLRSASAGTVQPRLDYRCVLFGPHSVLKFSKISNNIYIERLHIETHLF